MWLKEVLMALDRLGNAICKGNSLCTVSGRTGYYSENVNIKSESVSLFWTTLEKIIDWAFLPIDGPNHCKQTYKKEKEILTKIEERYMPGSDEFRVVLALFAVPVCLIAGLFLRTGLVKERANVNRG